MKKVLKNKKAFTLTEMIVVIAIIGILAVDEKGNTIAEWNSNLPMLTASTSIGT